MSGFLHSRMGSFLHAWDGLRYLLRTQRNAWIHTVITILVILVGAWLSLSASSWAIILLTTGLVWAAECFNTAVETIIDLVSPQNHPLAKISKDVAAGGVLVCAITAVIIGIVLLGPPLLEKLALK